MQIPTLTFFTGTLTLTSIVTNLLDLALYLAAVIAVGFLIYGGILFVTSGGDADKATKARNTILYAVVGVIVVVMAFAVVTWAGSVGTHGLKVN